MPGLDEVLGQMLGSGASLLTATVDTVGTGVCTVSYNGGQFDSIPYLSGGWTPTVGAQVYVVVQPGWGAFVLGSPATSAARTEDTPVEVSWTPSSIAHWNDTFITWEPITDGLLKPTGDGHRLGLWFYPQPLTLPFTEYASASLWLSVGDVTWRNDLPRAYTYLELFLHDNATADGAFTGETDSENDDVLPFRVAALSQQDVPLPFTWISRLIAGSAAGIGVRATDDPQVNVELNGRIRITKL